MIDPSSRQPSDPGDKGGAPLGSWDRIVLSATVASTGAAVMVLELLGTRVIGPFYGVSLYVWSSLIAVTLFALALGYYLGGWCADYLPRLRLAHVVMLAALGTAAIAPGSRLVLLATDHLGLAVGALVSALVLFAPALTCLGMTGPFVIRLATRRLENVGTIAGVVYAVSTLGSVCATLATGFFLLSWFGTRAILLCTAGALFLLAIALAVYERRRLGARQVAIAAACVVIGLPLSVLDGLRPAPGADGFVMRSEAESVYGWVRVVDDERRGIRLLLSDGSSIAAQSIATRRTMLAYQEFLDLLPLLAHADAGPSDALVIGLGGGHVATALRSAGMVTDTIEIDPAVAEAAVAQFAFRPTGAFIVGDGRYEIRKLNRHYRLVILDCFTGGAEPLHLLTRETFRDLKALLADDGVLALNFVGFARGDGSQAVASVAATLADVFTHRRTFVTLPHEAFTDFVFLASGQPIAFAPRDDADRHVLAQVARHEFEAPTVGGVILTDDFNPLEGMQVRKTAVYRTRFMERVAANLLVR